jgi:hypothetical protein
VARQVLRFLGTRYGFALVLVVLVIGVVAVARVASGPPDVESVGPPAPVVVSSGPDAELGDDSIGSPESSPVPSTIPGAAPPDVVAVDFAKAWLKTKGVTSAEWIRGLKPYSTQRLLDRLAGADPKSVPATSVRGPAQIRVRDAVVTEVSVPVQPGVLNLRLTVGNNRWLVDGVDWERP